MTDDSQQIANQQGTLRTYVTGLTLCLILTLAAFFLIYLHILSGWILFSAITILALIQAWVQLVLFLHLGHEKAHPHWNMIMFLFMLIVAVVVILGSIWIMANLNYNTMTM